MKKAASIVLAMFYAALAFVVTAQAADNQTNKTVKINNDTLKMQIAEKLKDTKITVNSVGDTPVEGVYEVIGNNGATLMYYAPQADVIIFGEMYDQSRKSITAARKIELQSAKIKDIPLADAIRIGSGKNVVIEFTDPDCPYCRQAAKLFEGKNVTQYVFLFPLKGLHPQAEDKCKYILSAADPGKAYYEVINGWKDKDDLANLAVKDEVKNKVKKLEELGQKLGIAGTPAIWINGNYVPGVNQKMIESLLAEK